MPCYKCSNGKWKYGKKGNCQFDTLEECQKAEIAINISKGKKPKKKPGDEDNDDKRKKDCGCN